MIPSFEILKKVALAYDMPVKLILDKKRTQHVAEARQVVAYLLRELNNLSYPAIGKILGRDHTTVIHAHEKISERIKKDQKFKKVVEELATLLIETTFSANLNDVGLLLPDEIRYLHETLEREKSGGKLYYAKTSQDILAGKRNLDISEREANIVAQYRAGMTLEEISSTTGITRERVRQIVLQTLMKELGQKAREGFNIDVEEYVNSQKEIHKKSKLLSEDQKEDILKKLSGGASITEILRAYKLSKKNFLFFFPQYENAAELMPKRKKWSRFYEKCRGCGTGAVPHVKRGYCEKCVGSLRGTRRENIIRRFGDKCVRCGISRQDSFRKYKRDFHLTKDLAGEPFAPLCRGCFLHLGGINMANKRWKKQ